MSLLISYQDVPGRNIYANLFSATNKLKAFNPDSELFETISLSSQSNFQIVLPEDNIRKGYYSYDILNSSLIPETLNGDFYLIEVFRLLGSGPDRESDTLVGTMAFYWDGEQEVDICGCQSIAGTSLSAQDVWNHSTRTLTSNTGSTDCPDVNVDLECPDPYITIENNVEGLSELQTQLELTDNKVDQIISLINDLSTNQVGLPNTSSPTIGPRGSSGGTSNIRIT